MYAGVESFPGFDHVQDMIFTWNMKILISHISVYTIITVSRLLILSGFLITLLCTDKVCSETWIRCLCATVSGIWYGMICMYVYGFLYPG